MRYLNSPYLTLIITGLFIVLASYSYGKYGRTEQFKRHAARVSAPVVLTMLHKPTNRELLIELGYR